MWPEALIGVSGPRQERIELTLGYVRGLPQHMHESLDRSDSAGREKPFQRVRSTVWPGRIIGGLNVARTLIEHSRVIPIIMPLNPGSQRLIQIPAGRPQPVGLEYTIRAVTCVFC